jgi:tetratricopeptide (TPR) repeat protein
LRSHDCERGTPRACATAILVVVRRLALSLILAGALGAQQPKPPESKDPNPKTRDSKAQEPKVEEPPEEDESLAPKVYSFNPLQAAKEVRIGDYYFKKKSYKAAMLRYREATRWNANLAEAWLKLGEADEKLKDSAGAREAYAKYVELAPDAKEAESIRKKLSAKR